MLIKLFPDQISDKWDIIKHALSMTLTDIKDDFNGILRDLLIGKKVCWVMVDDEEIPKGLVVTELQRHVDTTEPILLIYMLFIYSVPQERILADAMATMFNYAKSEECTEIYAFSRASGVINMAQRYGADVQTRRISFVI